MTILFLSREELDLNKSGGSTIRLGLGGGIKINLVKMSTQEQLYGEESLLYWELYLYKGRFPLGISAPSIYHFFLILSNYFLTVNDIKSFRNLTSGRNPLTNSKYHARNISPVMWHLNTIDNEKIKYIFYRYKVYKKIKYKK